LADAFSTLAEIDLDFVSLGQGPNSLSLVTAVLGRMKSVPQDVVDKILHHEEKQIYNRIKDNRRRYQFLMGRYVAKRNLGRDIREFQMSDVAILRDPMGKPTIKSNQFLSGSISISHVDNLAVAIAGPGHNIGVDIEIIRKSLMLIGPTILSKHEKHLMSKFSFSQEGELEGIVWSAKEAVSKFLGTGITGSLNDFAISGCRQVGLGSYQFSFRNFERIRAHAYVATGLVLNLATDDSGFETNPELLLSRLESLGKSFQSFRSEEFYAA